MAMPTDMHDNTRGGNDTLNGGERSFNNLFGDARIMDGDSRGGNDILVGGAGRGGSPSVAVWRCLRDARPRARRQRHPERWFCSACRSPWRRAHHGRRQFVAAATAGSVGAAGTNDLFGDAFEMHDRARGGDDQLTGDEERSPRTSTATPASWMATAAVAMTANRGSRRLRRYLYGDAFEHAPPCPRWR